MKKFFERGCALLIIALFGAILAGCSALESKAVGGAGAVDALKIETSGGTATGTLLPNITMGGAVSAIATSPTMADGSTAAPVISFAQRTSWLGELFGVSADTTAFTYIGVPGETSTDTSGRIAAAAKFFTDAADDKKQEETPAASGNSEAATGTVPTVGEVTP